jgi:hypothetical protein
MARQARVHAGGREHAANEGDTQPDPLRVQGGNMRDDLIFALAVSTITIWVFVAVRVAHFLGLLR